VNYVGGAAGEGPTVLPTVSTAMLGLGLDIRPLLSFDRQEADLELRFSLADGWKEVLQAAGEVGFPAGEKKPAKGEPAMLGVPIAAVSADCGSVRLASTVTLGKYLLTGTFRRAGGETVALLVKIEPAGR